MHRTQWNHTILDGPIHHKPTQTATIEAQSHATHFGTMQFQQLTQSQQSISGISSDISECAKAKTYIIRK